VTAVFVLSVVGGLPAANAQGSKKAQEERGSAGSGAVERGKYIVEGVAMCGRCHTPNNVAGENDNRNTLLGGPAQIQPTYQVPNWAVIEPRIAGAPPLTDAQFIRLMTTGITRTGLPPNPPMPRFHMTRADAEAVLAYLKSLKE